MVQSTSGQSMSGQSTSGQSTSGNVLPPSIFDEKAHIQRLNRAHKLGFANFLLRRAEDELNERLTSILRNFDTVADIGTPLPIFSQKLAGGTDASNFKYLSPENFLQDADRPLPLKTAYFSLIVSAMALHAVNDLPGTFVQIRRALRPDGLFMACIPGGRTLNELRTVLQIAEEEITGGISPRVFPFADIKDFGILLQRAGFKLPVTDVDTVTVRYNNMYALMHDLRKMGATNILRSRLNYPTRRSVFERASELYIKKFSDSDGRIKSTFEFIWVSGWAEHESQRKPLKPGSAKQKLADVLQKYSHKD